MRRTWMLLFVIALLAIFMAVPAMAAECPNNCPSGHCYACCDGTHEGWTELTSSTAIVDGGKYYLTAELARNLVIGNKTVTICLNGQNWTGSGTSRPLQMHHDITETNPNPTALVNIVDCSAVDANGLSQGTITGVASTSSQGGGAILVNQQGCTLNIYNGTIIGGACTSSGGGAVTVNHADAAINFIGGRIQGSAVPKNGGSVYVAAGTFTMGVRGNTSKTFPSIEGGSVTAASTNGGSVFVKTGATFTLHSGLITGGEAPNGGGNFYANGTVNITGGKIYGGTAKVMTYTDGMFGVNATLNISGGECDELSNSGTTTLSGSPTLTNLRITKAGALKFEDPASFTGSVTISSSSTTGIALIAKPENATAEQWFAYDKLISTAAPKVTANAPGSCQLAFAADGIYFYAVDGTRWNCYCGMIGGSHSIGCQTENPGCYDVEWTAWDGTSNLQPTEEGTFRYYLTQSLPTRNSQIEIGTGASGATLLNHVVIDFNGHSTHNGRAANSEGTFDSRIFSLYPATSATFCNTSATTSVLSCTGGSSYPGVMVRTQDTAGRSFSLMDRVTLRVDDTNEETAHAAATSGGFGNLGERVENINIYGGKIEVKTQNTMARGGVIYLAGSNNLNIYGTAELVAGNSAGNGGVIYCNTGTVNMYGGTISGGTAVKYSDGYVGQGGAVYVGGTTFNMYAGTIQGCSAVDNGGAVYVGKGTFNMYGGTIKDCSADKFGGGICLQGSGKVNMIPDSNRTIPNAAAPLVTNCTATKGGGRGGNVFVSTGTFTMGHGTIQNGHNLNGGGGNLRMDSGSFVMNGGTIKDGDCVNGGGNINLYRGTFTMNGGTISGGTYKGNGGSIAVQGTDNDDTASKNATLILNGGTITRGGGSESASHSDTLDVGGFVTVNGTKIVGDVRVGSGKTIAVGTNGLGAGSAVTLLNENTGNGVAITSGIASLTAAETFITMATSKNADYVVGVGDDNQIFLTKPEEFGVVVNGQHYGLSTGIAKSAENAVITLNGAYTGDVTVGKNVILNLNGNTITGNINVADGVTLKLADSTAVGYTEGTGAVTGTIIGTVARTFTTGKNSPMGGNYRFLVLAETTNTGTEEEPDYTTTYTAHRIYLAVKSTVLVPFLNEDTYIKYRTYFKCDEAVAAKVTDYGAKVTNVTTDNTSDLSYVNDETLKYVVKADDLNNLTIGMNEIFSNDKSENVYSARAYITIDDDFGSEATVTSAASSQKTLRSLVETADGKWDELNLSQQNALKAMWNKFNTYMTGWTLNEEHYN